MPRPKTVNRRFSLKAHWKTSLPYCTRSQNKLSWLELFLILEICLNGNCQVWWLLGAGQVILFHRGKRTSRAVWMGLRWCPRLLLRLSAERCVRTACSRKGASPPEESLRVPRPPPLQFFLRGLSPSGPCPWCCLPASFCKSFPEIYFSVFHAGSCILFSR